MGENIMRASVLLTLLSAVTLSACGAMRPPEAVCELNYSMATGATGEFGSQSSADPLANPEPILIEQEIMTVSMVDTFREAVVAAPVSQGPLTVEVLALSAGGQFGAFGAGFLRGWAENPVTPRPTFRLVTGVSAGAMIAPIVFAGSEFDEALDGYRGLAEEDIFERRKLTSLLSAPSFGNVTPLENFLSSRLTDDLISSIAKSHDEGRGLFIMATDLDGTQAAIFNLGEIASSDQSFEQKRKCLRETMLASSAIPGLFPPRNIDGGLFADGGLRDQIFLQSIEQARQDIIRETGRDIRVSATIVINGSLLPPVEGVSDGLLNYARRGAVILADEVLRDSISEVVRFAQSQPNWTVRGMIADTDLSGCEPGAIGGTFDACVTQTIFDDGREKGRMREIPWLGPEALLDEAAQL